MKYDNTIKPIKSFLRPVYRIVRRTVRFLRWVFPWLNDLYLGSLSEPDARRVLVIYDTTSQPFSVGDLLLYLEASLVLCEKYKSTVVDLALVYNPIDPAASNQVFAGKVSEDSVMFHLASILPLAQVNQLLGSVFIFNSQQQLQRHVSDNIERYHVWPSSWLVSSNEYLSPNIFNDLLYQHYKKTGSIPHLSCRTFLRNWALSFYHEHLHGLVPVTVNIRNNKSWHLHRNSILDSWIGLFTYCESRYSVKFVVICAHSEIDDRFRLCGNVIIAKDHHTTVEQDMSLIHMSAIHMGTSSGPTAVALFGSKPYLIVNSVLEVGDFYYYSDMFEYVREGIQRFWFGGQFQHVANGAETAEVLIDEFARMWVSVDLQHWQASTNGQVESGPELNMWLR